MQIIPEMPDDWWPDFIVARLEIRNDDQDKWLSISVAVTPEEANHPDYWALRLKMARESLWQAKHAPEHAA